MYWDDGEESNLYVTGLGTGAASNINFTGTAQISKNLSAGFVSWIEIVDSDLFTITQDNPTGPGGYNGKTLSPQTLLNFWYLKDENLGQISFGMRPPAESQGIQSIDASGTLPVGYWQAYGVYSFDVRGDIAPGTEKLVWQHVGSCRGNGAGPGDCNSIRDQMVRYDSPSIAGFVATVSWKAKTDSWAFALRYLDGKFGDFAFQSIISYSESDTNWRNPLNGTVQSNDRLSLWQAGAYLQHKPTGLFVLGAWSMIDQKINPLDNPESSTWYLKVGGVLSLTSLGSTIPFAEYIRSDDGVAIYDIANLDGGARVIDGSQSSIWGVGVVQNIDAAAMKVWLAYRHHEVDVPGRALMDAETFSVGSQISF